MLYPSILLLASAGIAIAQSANECETFANATELLQAENGIAYCSLVLSLGTSTNTVVGSTTIWETSTLTTPVEVEITTTTTQTDTISSGIFETTAETFFTTYTSATTSTEYSCASPLARRGLDGRTMPYAVGKTTSSPQPTSTPDEQSDECDEDENSEDSPAEYHTHSPAYITVYPPSAPQGQVLTLSYEQSSYNGRPTPSSYADQPQASGVALEGYKSGTIGSSYSYSTLAGGRPHVSSNSTMYYGGGATASSRIPVPHVSGNSTVLPTGGPTASSAIVTTPTITPTPAPKPTCESAPIALRTGYACDTISTACGCLGITQATEDFTTVSTYFETITFTTITSTTTTIEFTETEFVTVPSTTLTITPTATITEMATATETVCPCSGSTSSLCGTTPDACKDLQTDTSNCGSCGNTCSSGQTCSAGICLTPAIPETPSCATSSCGGFIRCGNGGQCYCAATTDGKGLCFNGGISCSRTVCNASSDCPGEAVCAINTCCGRGTCITPSDVCPNAGLARKMFRRRTWDGQTVAGDM
jgi:hypothetical protein